MLTKTSCFFFGKHEEPRKILFDLRVTSYCENHCKNITVLKPRKVGASHDLKITKIIVYYQNSILSP